jgi:hypothetical protein
MIDRVSLVGAIFAGLLAEAGIIGAHRGMLAPIVGFRALLVSFVVASIALILGLAGILRNSDGERRRQRTAVTGVVLGALIAFPLGFAAMRCVSMAYPEINDITTDFENPPQFVSPPGLSPKSMMYDRARLEPIQKRYYPRLGPLLLGESPDEAFASVKQAANVPRFAGMEIASEIPSMPGWFIVFVDPATRTVEGIETSSLFRFRDDFVIQVRPSPDAKSSVVEMRSRSRSGAGDFGANYNRVVEFLGLVKSRASTLK